MSSKEAYELLRLYGGLSLEYTSLTEVEWASAPVGAYVPPEMGGYKVVATRTVQLLSDATGVIETFQASGSTIRLPANTLSFDTNDAGNGRLFFIKNSGSGSLSIQNYPGTELHSINQFGCVLVVGNDNDNWDFYFKAQNIPHNIIEGMVGSDNVQSALEYLFGLFRDVMKEPTGFLLKYEDSVLTYSDVGRSVTIMPKTPAYQFFTYYIRGKVHTVSTARTYQVADVEGLWYFYFNGTESFEASQNPWQFGDSVSFVTIGYWDSTNKKWIRQGEERHGLTMDFDTHRNLHNTRGTQIRATGNDLEIVNFTEIGSGNNNSDAQYGILDGFVYDEDIPVFIKNAAAPVNPYEQLIYPIANIPVFYLLGVDNWRKKDATAYPFYENPPALPYYNRILDGLWSLQPVPDGYFFATFQVYTTDLKEPALTILGQRTDANVIDAVNNNTRSGLIIPRKFAEEFYFHRKLIWEVSTSFTNVPKCRLRFIATQTETNPANDRYPAICNYNGNAGAGKYLEFFAGQSSDTSPFPIPEPSYLKTVIISTISINTATIGLYRSSDLINPFITISYTNSKYARFNYAYSLNSNEKLVVKVITGSMTKPAILLFFQTNL